MEGVGGAQPPGAGGRKRVPNRERPAAAEDDALNQIAREAEARLAAKRAARAEAREIRMKELERQQKEVEERPEKDFEKGVRSVSSLSAATLASLGGTSSRRGSEDTSISLDTEASIREIKDSLAEVEEKYKKAMVSNAQLDNEKTNFMYQVDTLKDALVELEEQLAESRRQYEEKSKDFEREKHAHAVLQFQFLEVKEALKQREELLAEIHQLQQKQESYSREISDLQETVEWKEKKIGALERQKEFFDSIRSERDGLREEVVMLKEQLKQHGIISKSEVTANGETADGLDNGVLASSSKIVPGTGHAPEVAGDDILGRANEVEMKNEILENVGKGEILQNTEHEEHTEEEQEIVQECSEIKPLHADGNVEAETVTEGKVVSTLMLSSGLEEPAKSLAQDLPEMICSLENSGAIELRGEGGLLGDTREVKDGNGLNKIDHQNKEASLCIEGYVEINTGLEKHPKQQNKGKQVDVVSDEAEENNSEVFQEALEFVNSSGLATSSQSESPELVEDMLAKASVTEPSSEQPESMIVEGDLSKQLVNEEANIAIGDKAGQNENEVGGNNEGDEMKVAVHQQKSKIAISESEQAEHAPNKLTEEQKQVEMEEIQSLSSEHDAFVEEEQNEQKRGATGDIDEPSLSVRHEHTESLLEAPGAYEVPEGKDEQHATKEEPVEGDVTHSQHHSHEEKNLDIEHPRKCSEGKAGFIDDGKPLAGTSTTPEEADGDAQEEHNSKQVKDTLGEEQSEARREETVSGLDTPVKILEDVEEVGKEDKNHGLTEKNIFDGVPDIVNAACFESQRPEFIDQEKDPDSEEEAGEEYHEAQDYSESPLEGQRTIEWSEKQRNKLETISHQTQEEKGWIAESTVQDVNKENNDKERGKTERLAEENKQKPNWISPDEMADEVLVTENKNVQHGEEGDKPKEAGHLQTDAFISEPSGGLCEMPEDTNREILYEISSRQIAEYTSEQLERLGASMHESQEESQPGRKGKGKSREDCVLA